jgi:hypothetical protein
MGWGRFYAPCGVLEVESEGRGVTLSRGPVFVNVRGELYVLPASSFRSQTGDESCAASMWTTTSSVGSMPRGACSSAVATRRTRNSRDSRGLSTWSRSARSTTPTPGDRCRCRVLPVPCRSANVRGGSSGQPGQGKRRESATDVRLDGDEMAADADDGDAGHYSGTYICRGRLSRHLSFAECAIAAASSPRTTTAVMSNVSTRGLAPHGSQYTRPGQSRGPYGTTRNATMAPAMATPKAARSQPFTGAIVRRAWTRDASHYSGTYMTRRSAGRWTPALVERRVVLHCDCDEEARR